MAGLKLRVPSFGPARVLLSSYLGTHAHELTFSKKPFFECGGTEGVPHPGFTFP